MLHHQKMQLPRQESFSLGDSSGLTAIGGQKGKALPSLPGSAYTIVSNGIWTGRIELVRDEHQGRITYWDGVTEGFDGIHSIVCAVDQYAKGNQHCDPKLP